MHKKTSGIRAVFDQKIRSVFENLLPEEVTVNGQNPWDPHIHDERFYEAIALRGTLGLGEAYMYGWWSSEALDVFFQHVLEANLLERLRYHPVMLVKRTKEWLFNYQTRSYSREVIEKHYDPGSDVILSFLDPYNQYTCGYWKDCDNLNTAQERKLDLICRKLELKPSDQVLDIGCGWYGFAKYAALHCGCRVTGITIAKEQIAYGKEYCKGLPVTIKYCDYRDLEGTYDKILICGMSEHVGYKNYRVLASSVHRCLDPNGLFLWHTIGKSSDIPIEEPWVIKYIFPNGMIPTTVRIARAGEGLFDMKDMHEFGEDYEKTLMAWRKNFVTNWPRVGRGRSEQEYRMWYYYLSVCAALFRVRKLQLWQFVFRKAAGPPYTSVR